MNRSRYASLTEHYPRESPGVKGILIAAVLLIVLVGVSGLPANAASLELLRKASNHSDAPAFQSGEAQLTFTPASSSMIVGNTAVITISLASIANLYGYQFQVNYDSSKVSAVGAFVNGLVDTTSDAFMPTNWNAVCNGGVCKFAVTKQNPASPVTGTGPLAYITFTGVNAGTVPLSFSADILADRDGNQIAHTASTSALTVYGTANITGTVSLQGRTTPITSGTVTLSDEASKFSPTVVDFDQATGVFSATVPVDLGGSTYDLLAAHSLYLSNRLTGVAVSTGDNYNVGATELKGGDANNNGMVDIFDLGCVGGSFHSSPAVCGTNGSSDINADGVVNIFDLALVGGNFHLSSPQPW